MADLKISELPAVSGLDGTELLAGVQAGDNVKILVSEVAEYINQNIAIAKRSVLYKTFTLGANDDEFDGESTATWIDVANATPVVVWTEDNDVLSFYHPGGGSSAQLVSKMQAVSPSIGDYIEICFQQINRTQSFDIIGLLFADGDTYGAGTQVAFAFSPSQANYYYFAFANYNSDSAAVGTAMLQNAFSGHLIMRFVYVAANTWRGYISTDGINFVPVGSNYSRTLTPTHMGFFVSTWGGANPTTGHFKYFRKGS